jgi:hypothetical protein
LQSDGWPALRSRFGAIVAPILWLFASIAPAAAQISQQASYADPSFQTVLNNPANLASQVKYAAESQNDPDLENAIGAYDRLLFYNPALSRVRFELGVLYARLGSYQQARAYFESALQMRDITPEMAEQAQEYIAMLDRKLSPDQFTGFAQTGLRYQTNATLGPGPQPILASGRSFNSTFTSRPDWNWFGAFALNYSHDFGTQDGDAFEATLLGYDAQQFKVHQVDLGLAELRAGPRFVFPDSNGASIKPYVATTGGLLADQVYSGGIGGGVTVHANVLGIGWDPYAEVIQQSYRNSDVYPLASGLGGPLTTVALQAYAPIVSGWNLQARIAYQRDDANFNPYGYNAFFADLWLPWNFSFPGDRRVWTITPSFGVIDWFYFSPDPFINPTTTQHSIEWRVALGLDVPIFDQFYLTARVQYLAIVSNISVFAMHDLQVSAGPTLKF